MANPLLVNLSFLIAKPTGLATYGLNLVPHLDDLKPLLLSPLDHPGYRVASVAGNMSAEQGSAGHARRLTWTQLTLPHIYRTENAGLLFSPIPEAPLGLGVRFAVTVHDFIARRFSKPTSPLALYTRYYVPQVLRRAQHIITNSEATARDAVDFCGVSAHKITSIPLAYDGNHFKDLELPVKPYFLHVGRHDPHKNVARVLAAFARLSSTIDGELWLAGTPDSRYTPQLRDQATEYGLSDRVRFLDYVPYAQLPVLINQAIAVVFPSLWEGFGLPVLEAMACGTPVITSNLSSLPEVAGDAGLLVDPYSVAAISGAMKAIATDDVTRRHLKQAGLKRATQFSWEWTGEETRRILGTLL
ncbi:MAG: glycosyltransferase family 1 protein [Elainellaceae cyanobacterium]